MRKKQTESRRPIHGLIGAALLLIGIASGLEAQDAVAALDHALTSNDKERIAGVEKELFSDAPALDTLLAAGSLLGQHGRMQEAAAVFARGVERFPDSFEARYDLALTRLALNQNREAAAALDGVKPASAAEQAANQYLRGKIELASGNQSQARGHLEAAYRARPQEENYALDLALLYIRAEAYVPAIEVLETASRLHAESDEIRLELALAEVLAGRSPEAIALAKKLTQNDVEPSLAGLIATFAYCTHGDYQACEDKASDGLRSAKAHPYLYYLRAMARWNLTPEEHGAQLADLNTVVAKLPACGVCLQLRSRVFESMRDNKAAIADMQRAVKQDSRSAAAWYRLSMLYKKTGDKQLQAETLRRYEAIHSGQADQEKESFRQLFLETPTGEQRKQ